MYLYSRSKGWGFIHVLDVGLPFTPVVSSTIGWDSSTGLGWGDSTCGFRAPVPPSCCLESPYTFVFCTRSEGSRGRFWVLRGLPNVAFPPLHRMSRLLGFLLNINLVVSTFHWVLLILILVFLGIYRVVTVPVTYCCGSGSQGLGNRDRNTFGRTLKIH